MATDGMTWRSPSLIVTNRFWVAYRERLIARQNKKARRSWRLNVGLAVLVIGLLIAAKWVTR